MAKATYNKKLPKYYKGVDLTKALGSASGIAGGLLDNTTQQTTMDADGREYKTQDDFAAFGSGALKGAAAGAALGPWGAAGGALIYGTASLFTNQVNTDKVNKAKAESLTRRNEMAYDNAVNNQQIAEAQGFRKQGQQYVGMYKKGGNLTPEYEVEGNEVVQGVDTQLEGQEQLASDMHKAVGPSHEDGGVLGQGGDRVFSDRLVASPYLTSALSALKIRTGKTATYASIADKLGKLKGKYEEKAESNNPLTYNTGKAMLGRIEGLIDAAFEDQELQKQNEEGMKTSYAKGGKLPKYFVGGDTPVLGAINPATGKPYTKEDIEIAVKNSEFTKPFGTEYGGLNSAGNQVYGKYTPSYGTKNKPVITAQGNNPADGTWKENKVPFTNNTDKAKLFDFTGGNTSVDTYSPSKSTAKRDYSDINKFVNPEQAINTMVYLSNLKRGDKQQTGFMPEVAAPAYMRNVNMLPYNKYMISKEAETMGRNIDMSSGNTQDRFARRMAVKGEAMDRINAATASQAERDMAVNNTNTQISNEYRGRKAEAKNKYLEMKTMGENAKLTNKQAATNAWLQGIMGNLATGRAYEVEKEKMQIARMDGGRGTAERSDPSLPFTKKYGFRKGGYIKK